MAVNVEELLTPVSADSPCGPAPADDISLYTEFSEIEKAANGTPEQVMGDSVIPAVEPSWGDVYRQGLQFLGRCKDLRTAVLLTRGMLHREGYVGMSSGLELVHSLLTNYWDDVHPRLVDEDGDPEYDVRINAIADMGSDMFIRDLHVTTLVEARAVGRFTYRDYRASRGDIQLSNGAQAPDMALIGGAFMEADLEQLQAGREALEKSINWLAAISQVFVERLPDEDDPDLKKLAQELKGILGVYDEFMAQRGLGTSSADEEDAETDAQDDAPRPAVRAVSGDINSREDVIRQLDKICQYYQRHEPSSPVPLILQRAKKLATMDFMAIMNDMCPDGIASVRHLAGVGDTE